MQAVSLVLSLAVHVGLVAWAYYSIASTPEFKAPEPEAISVAIITPSELLRLKKGSESAKELEAKAPKKKPEPEKSKKDAKKPKPVVAPIPPAETPDPIAEKIEEEKQKAAEAKKKAELAAKKKAEAEAKKKAEALKKKKAEEAKRKAAEKKKKAEALKKKKAAEKRRKEQARKKQERERKRKAAEKKRKQQAADRLAALLDKDPTKRGAPNSADEPNTDTDYEGPTAGTWDGKDNELSIREQDLLRAQITQQLRECWKLPGGGGGIETTVVTIRWMLRRDGTLDGEPRVEKPRSDTVFRIAAEAAIRAVKSCAPFSLPQDKYHAWRLIIWDFDPRQLL